MNFQIVKAPGMTPRAIAILIEDKYASVAAQQRISAE